MIDSGTGLYGLIGNPVEGSKSPWIHNHVFNTCDIPGIYMAFTVASEQLKSAVDGLKAIGVKGLNVTIPYKTDIIPYLDEIDAMAMTLGAVNTIVCVDGRWKGYNTDGPGLIAVLKRHVPDFDKKNLLVIGAGGASRGICGTLVAAGVKKLGIWNRTSDKALALVSAMQQLAKEGETVTAVSDETHFSAYDVIINTTSVGMAPETEVTPVAIAALKPGAVVCDIVYKPHRTLFIREAIQAGHPVIYGIEMLIEQALLAQKLWHGLSDDQLSKNRMALIKEFEGFHK